MNAGSSAKWMPGLMRKVKVRKSGETSGMDAAVLGRNRAGRARNSNSSGASKMPAATVREYRSVICAGSNELSAIGNA